MADLKPCPFCGHSAALESVGADHFVMCDGCCAETARFQSPTGDNHRAIAHAIAAWNNRAASPAALTDERIEAIWDSTPTAETGEEMRRRFARALLAASPAALTDAQIIEAIWDATKRDWKPTVTPARDENCGYFFTYGQLIDVFRALIAASPAAPSASAQQAEPDGWRLVPVHPTKEMREAGAKINGQGWDFAHHTWRTMLLHAPVAPAPASPVQNEKDARIAELEKEVADWQRDYDALRDHEAELVDQLRNKPKPSASPAALTEDQIVVRAGIPFVGLSVTLMKALRRLSFAAQTSGGVAGRDDELMGAIKQAQEALEAAKGKGLEEVDVDPAPASSEAASPATHRQPVEMVAGVPDALGYATSLANSIWRRYYKADAPDWQPLDTVIGVLTQIDNMVSGMRRVPDALTDAERAQFDAFKREERRAANALMDCAKEVEYWRNRAAAASPADQGDRKENEK